MAFQENHSNGSQDTFDTAFRSPSKVPLITDQSQSYTFRRTRMKSDSSKFPEWKPRYSAQGNMFPKQSSIHYWRIATKLTSFPEKERRVRNMTYQENSSNWSRDIYEKVFCYANKVSLITERARTHLARFVAHAWKMRGMRFLEYPSNGSRDIEENILRTPTKHYSPIATILTEFVAHASRIGSMKMHENRYNGSRDASEWVLRSPTEVPFIMDRTQPKLSRFHSMRGKWEVWSFRNIPPMESEIRAKMYCVIQLLALHCWPIATTLIEFVAHVWRIRSMEFKKNPYDGSRDAADMVSCRPHILLLTVHRRTTLAYGPDWLSRNVGNKLPISAAKHSRTTRISHRGRNLISRNTMSIIVILFKCIKWSFTRLLNALDFLHSL